MASKVPPIWLLAGPTASGKSALAARLARAAGAEIVNADSMQIYADIPILSGQPTAEEQTAAPHHLYGVADAADTWSAGQWLAVAAKTLEGIASRDRPAIVVGGTGLYFTVLTRGLASMPSVPLAARDDAAARLGELGEAAFRDELRRLDPAAERRIALGDRQRLVRAWSVRQATGRPLSAWWSAATSPPLASGLWRAVVLDPPRAEIAARCEVRLRRMIEAGVLAEVERLIARRLDPGLPAMKALGLAPMAACLAGTLGLEDAVAGAAAQTRRYAKRQATWFRHQQPQWPRIAAAEPDAQLEMAEHLFGEG